MCRQWLHSIFVSVHIILFGKKLNYLQIIRLPCHPLESRQCSATTSGCGVSLNITAETMRKS